MIDAQTLQPGDVLIGFSRWGHVSVVSNKPGKFGTGRDIVIAYHNGRQAEVNVLGFAEHIHVLKSSW